MEQVQLRVSAVSWAMGKARSACVAVLSTLLVLGAAGSGELLRAAGPERHVELDLRLRALTEPLQNLSAADRQTVDETISLITRKEHGLALAHLTALSASNPMNSALRVLRAYALLELGNVTGALDEARTAEESEGHSAYKCWFLAQVAYIAGNKPLCRREIKHLQGNTVYGAGAVELRKELEAKSKK